MTKMNNDGVWWNSWGGGAMPIDGETRVIIQTKRGQREYGPACEFRWDWQETLNDIMMYRVLDPNDLQPPALTTQECKTAPDLLKAGPAQHMADRAKTYDKPDGERSMGNAVRAFNIITGKDLSEAEGWLLLQILKDVRQWQNTAYHADSAEDCIAYAALKAEALQCQS